MVFLVQDFVCRNESMVEEWLLWLFFRFLSWKNNFFAYEEKIGLAEKELLKYHQTANFCVWIELFQ